MSKQFHKRPLISGGEVLRLVSDAIAFSKVASLATEEMVKLVANQDDYNKPIRGGGWPGGMVWESLHTVSHFNLANSLELALKALVRLDQPQKQQNTHRLRTLYDSIDQLTKNRLDAAWTLIYKYMPIELVAYVNTKFPQPPNKPKSIALRDLKDWFLYFDTDLQMYTKRYSWENIAKEKYRHYIKDLKIFFCLFEILRALVLDRAMDRGVLSPGKESDEWRRSPDVLPDVSVDDLEPYYRRSGWHRNDRDRWKKRRTDGNHILVHRPDLFWKMLAMEGENFLTVEIGRAWSSTVNLDDGRSTAPVLVAELMTGAAR